MMQAQKKYSMGEKGHNKIDSSCKF